MTKRELESEDESVSEEASEYSGDENSDGEQQPPAKAAKRASSGDLESRVAQLEAENEALKRKNKSLTTDLAAARRKSAGSPGSAAGSLSPVAAQAQAKSIESAMIKALSAQMVYKPSLKNPGKSAITQFEMPNVAEPVAAAFLGAKWKCTAKTKLVKAAGVELPVGGKGLRYGAVLDVPEGFTVTWAREGGVLKARGKYQMLK